MEKTVKRKYNKKKHFKLDTTWLVDGSPDFEYHYYKLMDFIKFADTQIDKFELYPLFSEMSLHLANLQSITSESKYITIDKKFKCVDDEILITELKFSGSDIYGREKILDTPMGKIVQNFIEEGVGLGVSSRGLGSLKEKNGVNEVQDDFHLATVDIVADPSAPDAFVQGIMESAEWILENGLWKTIDIELAQNAIKKTSKANLSEMKLSIFKQFLGSIK